MTLPGHARQYSEDVLGVAASHNPDAADQADHRGQSHPPADRSGSSIAVVARRDGLGWLVLSWCLVDENRPLKLLPYTGASVSLYKIKGLRVLKVFSAVVCVNRRSSCQSGAGGSTRPG